MSDSVFEVREGSDLNARSLQLQSFERTSWYPCDLLTEEMSWEKNIKLIKAWT